ncbi:MAG: DNA-directed RNA polymerase subunit alpha [Clostridia bacterium]|nr:DNA-directed RNA polymerase subunit alpha [Clostridia bacterium]
MQKIFNHIRIEEPATNLTEEGRTGSLTMGPLRKGYGTTIGNSLRRVMLSSLPGAACVSICVACCGETVLHEFSTVKCVKEDMCEIVLNVKGIVVKLHSESEKTVYLDAEGPGVVRAGDLAADADLEIINPDLQICTLSDGASLHMEFRFDHGVGYVSAAENRLKYGTEKLGELYVDSIFSPVLRVNYVAETARVGGSLDFEELKAEVLTNGAIAPSEAFVSAAEILKAHYNMITALAGVAADSSLIVQGEDAKRDEILDMTIEDLQLSCRSYHCLKRDGVDTVRDLVAKTKEDMMRVRNLGEKSLKEIIEKLRGYNLTLAESEN